MLKAKDIMTEDVISVKRKTSIYEALELFLKNNITGIPVIRDDMTLIGILSEKDVLKLFDGSEENENKTVNDFMSQPAIHFDEEESFQDVYECLAENYFRRVPVTSGGKLIGIISRRDIVKYILQQRGKSGDTG
ncbi:MAG: CBS domain-containing protein [Planctomycetota bacterium]